MSDRDVAALSCWVPRLRRVGRLNGHRGCVNTIQWSPNGNFLISGSDDTKVWTQLECATVISCCAHVALTRRMAWCARVGGVICS
jgi:WD40 repeat protein